MRAFFTIVLGLVCLVLLILGNLHWQKKIDVTSNSSTSQPATASKDEDSEAFAHVEPVLDYTANWSIEEKEYFRAALSEKRPYQILIVGSEQMGKGESSWPVLFEKEMVATYGEGTISVEAITYNETTAQFVELGKQADLIKHQADLIIWEPFILSDNGVVPVEGTLENISSTIHKIKETNPGTAFVLQPPNPLYQPKLYKTQVDELKAYADENDIPYLDHWSNWPDPTTEQVREYLNEYNQPNEEGHRIWADYLVHRFISE